MSVVLSVGRAGVVLTDYAASLGGIASDSGDAYLIEVANELLDEALDAAECIFKKLVE